MGIPAPLGATGNLTPPAGDQASVVVAGTLSAVAPGAACPVVGWFNISVWGSINTSLQTTIGSLTATVGNGTGLATGNAINSVNVPPGTFMGNLAGTTATLALSPISMVGFTVSGKSFISGLPSTSGLVNATVTGPGIPSGTVVSAVTVPAVAGNSAIPPVLGTVELSANATATTGTAGAFFSFAPDGHAILVSSTDANALFTGAVAYSGTIEIERSFDGGSTWMPVCLPNTFTAAKQTSGAAFTTTLFEPELGVLYRVACTAYTSGTINYRISAGALQTLAKW